MSDDKSSEKKELNEVIEQLARGLGISIDRMLIEARLNKQQWRNYLDDNPKPQKKAIDNLVSRLRDKGHPISDLYYKRLYNAIGITEEDPPARLQSEIPATSAENLSNQTLQTSQNIVLPESTTKEVTTPDSDEAKIYNRQAQTNQNIRSSTEALERVKLTQLWRIPLWIWILGSLVVVLILAILVFVVSNTNQTITNMNWPPVKKGQSDERVRTVQYLLNHYDYAVEPDGIYGVKTENALITFQKANGLLFDGIVGPETWTKLIVQVKKGDSGEAVKAVQNLLRKKGYYSLKVTGDFDDDTHLALLNFQKRYFRNPKGQVDLDTWKVLVQ